MEKPWFALQPECVRQRRAVSDEQEGHSSGSGLLLPRSCWEPSSGRASCLKGISEMPRPGGHHFLPQGQGGIIQGTCPRELTSLAGFPLSGARRHLEPLKSSFSTKGGGCGIPGLPLIGRPNCPLKKELIQNKSSGSQIINRHVPKMST